MGEFLLTKFEPTTNEKLIGVCVRVRVHVSCTSVRELPRVLKWMFDFDPVLGEQTYSVCSYLFTSCDFTSEASAVFITLSRCWTYLWSVYTGFGCYLPPLLRYVMITIVN